MVITNSTISGNFAFEEGGGIYNVASITVNNCTVTTNHAQGGSGGGAWNGNLGDFLVKSSIVAVNEFDDDVAGNFLSGGFNLIGMGTGSTGFTAATDQTGTITRRWIQSLIRMVCKTTVGPRKRSRSFFGSPAIDKGTSALPIAGNLHVTDQRGAGFPAHSFDDPQSSQTPTAAMALTSARSNCKPARANSHTPTPTPTPTAHADTPNVVQFSSSNYSVQEDCTTVTITVNRIGDTSGAASVDYNTSDVTATERKDYITALGLAVLCRRRDLEELRRADQRRLFRRRQRNLQCHSEQSFRRHPRRAGDRHCDDHSTMRPSLRRTRSTIRRTLSASTITIFSIANRTPSGLDFWTNQITSCGTDQACIEVRRINVSASFFLSIEFQDTGYLVERIYKAAYGDADRHFDLSVGSHQLAVPVVRLNEFLSDTQEIGQGVIVGQGNWQQQIENNKQAFTRGICPAGTIHDCLSQLR